MGRVGHEAGECVHGSDRGDLVHVDVRNRAGEVGLAFRAGAEGGHEAEGSIVLAWGEAGVATEGEQVDLLAGRAGVVAGDAEAAILIGEDVVAGGIRGHSGLGGVQHGDAGRAVAGGVGGKEVDVGANDGLLSAVDVADNCRAGVGGRSGRSWWW